MVSPDGIKLDEGERPAQLISALLHPNEMTTTDWWCLGTNTALKNIKRPLLLPFKSICQNTVRVGKSEMVSFLIFPKLYNNSQGQEWINVVQVKCGERGEQNHGYKADVTHLQSWKAKLSLLNAFIETKTHWFTKCQCYNNRQVLISPSFGLNLQHQTLSVLKHSNNNAMAYKCL